MPTMEATRQSNTKNGITLTNEIIILENKNN
jgi:hypothetical protein